MNIPRNQVLDLSFQSTKTHANPFFELQVTMEVTGGNQTLHIPAFWKGGTAWGVRFSAPQTGEYTYRTICSDTADAGLHNQKGTITVTEYQGDNPLYLHGRLTPHGNHFAHQDDTPFLWLGDTWWMSLCNRLRWPDEFETLLNDRVNKGFNVVQIIAGLYPDMPPFDQRGANEAGFPWAEDFSNLNPAYFDMMDRRIQRIVDAGLVPCIVGCWGYFIDFAGRDVLIRHWENLIARYAAYPVVWCAAGEGTMPFYGYYAWPEEKNARYLGIKNDPAQREAYDKLAKAEWTTILKAMKAYDPYHNMLSIHPSQFAHKTINEPELLDYNMLQTGHGGDASLTATVDMINEAMEATPDIPVFDSEVCYEGIGGMCGPDAQRFAFWSTVMSGAAGFTYGGNGIWQLNNPGKPFGASPHGLSWGFTTWEEAMNLPGSKQLGIAKKRLEQYRWWEFEFDADWVDQPKDIANLHKVYCAGIADQTMLFFMPSNYSFGKKPEVKILNDTQSYRATFIDLISGMEFDGGVIRSADGKWRINCNGADYLPVYGDMLLILEKV